MPSLGKVSMSTVGKSDIWASPGRCGKPPVPVTVKLPAFGRSRRPMQLFARRLSVSIRPSGNSLRLFWMKVVSGRVIFPEARVPVALISTRLLRESVPGSISRGALR